MPNLDSLKSLLRLQSPSNMTSTGDPYADKRRAQIISGDDEFAPSELEQMGTQLELGDRGLGVSRDMIRDSGMQALKQKLGMVTASANAKAQGDIATERVKGEYGVRAARESATAAEARAQANQDAIAARQREMITAVGGRQDKTIANQQGLQEDQQQFRVEHPTASAGTAVPQQLYKAVTDAKTGYDSPMGKVGRMLHMGKSGSAYEGALTALLDRKGTLADVEGVIPHLQQAQGATIDEKIVNSGVPGLQQLDPYERQYLALKLGL